MWQVGAARADITLIPIHIFSNNANLSNMFLTSGGMLPSFDANTTNYTNTYNGTTTQVSATAADSGATITVNGVALTGQYSQLINLVEGPNTITVKVLAADQITSKTYIIVVTKPAANSADLTGLSVSLGAVSPSFSSSTLNYTATEAQATSSVKVVAEVENDKAAVSINGQALTSSGTEYELTVPLNPGPNMEPIVVTSADKSVTKTYTLTITRESPTSSDANLSSMITNAGDLTPVFAPGTLAYTQPYSGPNILVKPVVEESHATVAVNGTAATSGQWSQAITLVSGTNTINVQVTAQDGHTTKTYTISITMPNVPKSTDANLSSLLVTPCGYSETFAPDRTAYTQSVADSVISVAAAPTAEESHASITVNGTAVNSGQSANVVLNTGVNKISIKVTAQDGTTTKTYVVTITRAALQQQAVSTDANLSGLSLSSGGFTPAFSPGTTGYSQSLDSSISTVKVTPTAEDSQALITINGIAAASGHASSAIALKSGLNTLAIKVIAPDGVTTKTYTVSINVSAPEPQAGTATSSVLVFTIGSTSYTVNDKTQPMDSAPVVAQGRTMLPIRYVATPLGASVDWRQDERKATVTLNGQTIELWIGKNTARLNNSGVQIDPDNAKVVPIVVPPGRTMLPLRLIAESLGCQVVWVQAAHQAIVTYPKP